MNIAEIRNNYPQYVDMSDEQIAKGMHRKYYADMDFGEFSKKIGYETAPLPQVSDDTRQEIADRLAGYNQRQNSGSELLKGLKAMDGQDWVDVANDSRLGAEKVASGATLGGYDWSNRKLGGDFAERQADFENRTGMVGKVALGGLDLAGNIVGAGGAMVKGLEKVVSSPTKLAAITGGLEGAAYGATGSDTLAELPGNMAINGAVGTVAAPVFQKTLGIVPAVGGRILKKTLRSPHKKAVEGLRTIGDEPLLSAIENAQKAGSTLAEVADKDLINLVQKAGKQTPAAAKLIEDSAERAAFEAPERMRGLIDRQLGNKTRGQNLAEIEDFYSKEAKPLYEKLNKIGDVENYEINQFLENINPQEIKAIKSDNPELYQSILKSIVRNEQKVNPDFRFAMKDGQRDYGHFLNDTKRQNYIGSLKSTLHNPDIRLNMPPEKGITRQFLAKRYKDAELGSDIWDIMVKKDGALVTKYPRENRAGRDSVRSFIKKGGSHQESDYPKLPLSQTGNSPSSYNLPDFNISKIGTIVKNNQVLGDAIKAVKRSNSSLKNLSDADFQVLNEARKLLSRQSRNYSDLSGYEARQTLKELDPVLYEVLPDLQKANKITSNRYALEEAQKKAAEVFNNRYSADEFGRGIAKMSQAEKDSMVTGIRNEILDRLGAKSDESKSLNQFLTKNVQDKLVKILGEEKAGQLVEFARHEIKRGQNINTLKRGLEPNVKGSLMAEFRRALHNPQGIMGQLFDNAADTINRSGRNRRNVAIARGLFEENPAQLLNTLKQLQAAEHNPLLNGVFNNPNIAPFAAANTKEI